MQGADCGVTVRLPLPCAVHCHEEKFSMILITRFCPACLISVSLQRHLCMRASRFYAVAYAHAKSALSACSSVGTTHMRIFTILMHSLADNRNPWAGISSHVHVMANLSEPAATVCSYLRSLRTMQDKAFEEANAKHLATFQRQEDAELQLRGQLEKLEADKLQVEESARDWKDKFDKKQEEVAALREEHSRKVINMAALHDAERLQAKRLNEQTKAALADTVSTTSLLTPCPDSAPSLRVHAIARIASNTYFCLAWSAGVALSLRGRGEQGARGAVGAGRGAASSSRRATASARGAGRREGAAPSP
eukprot:6213337-Pleurochrysis_carterae.AAC.2